MEPAAAFQAKAFHPGKALETLLDNRDLFKEMAGMFLNKLPRDIASIREAILGKDGGALFRADHSLKGSIGNFHADEAYKAVSWLEAMARTGNLDMAAAALPSLECTLTELAAEMTAVLQDMDDEDTGR